MTISTIIPDTITSWIASAFAVNSKSGLGIAPVSAKVLSKRNEMLQILHVLGEQFTV